MSIRRVSNYNFEYIVAITLDKNDNIYILDYLVTDVNHPLSYNIYKIVNNQVEIVTPSTTFQELLKDTIADELLDMSFNNEGILYVTGKNNLYKIDVTMPSESNVMLIGSIDLDGNPPGQGICFDSRGSLFFTKSTSPHLLDDNRGSIHVISSSDIITYSEIVQDIVVIVGADIQEPIGITTDKNDNKYVCNSSFIIGTPPQLRYISKYDKDHKLVDPEFMKPPIFLSRYGSWNNIKIDSDNQNIYAVYTNLSYDVASNTYTFADSYILQYDMSGKYIGIIKNIPKNSMGQHPLFVGSDNKIYYTDDNNTRIMSYSTDIQTIIPDDLPTVEPIGISFNNIMNIHINDICFPSFTPIHTNLGVVNIEDVNIGIHKINNQKILCVTKTISQDKHLVLIPKHSLGKNYPCKTTIMSKNHKLYHRGRFVEASYLVDKYIGVKYIPYKGDVLYNIVLENHSVVKINNLICETLHPNNPIAKLYLNVTNEDYKNKIISTMNYSIVHKDIQTYKKIISRF